MDDPEAMELGKRAVAAMEFAYCRYSNFQVGAALLCKDGTIFTGCNVENAAYGLCICAERTAMVKAVSEGRKDFKAIAVTSSLKGDAASPCGSCRQFLREFGVFDVLMWSCDMKKCVKMTTDELLPLAFVPECLERATAVTPQGSSHKNE